MRRFESYRPGGVIPATLLAFHDDLSIDERETRRHLRHVAGVRGISAITVNGHASEVHACSFEEQRRVLAITADEVGDRLPLVNGVYADGSLEAARIARMAQAEGASALLLAPDSPLRLYLGYLEDQPVATAELTLTADAAGVYNISTGQPWRGRGIGTALTAWAMREGSREGRGIAVLQAAPAGVGVYRRLGFEAFGELTLEDLDRIAEQSELGVTGEELAESAVELGLAGRSARGAT